MSKIYQNLSKKTSLFSSILLCLFSINAFAIADSTYTSANYTNIISNNVQNADYSSGSASTGVVSYKFKSENPLVWSSSKGIYVINPECFKSTWSVSQPSGSSAFIPTIKVQNNFRAFCLGYEATVTLHGYGQCAFFGLVRVCARNTPFCQYGNDIACDSTSSGGNGIAGSTSPGGTGKSLPTDMCPNCLDSTNYRICVFEDPMFPGDATDIKANAMPFHQKTSISPSVTGGDSLVALGLFITSIGLLVPGLGAGAIVVGCGIMAAGGIMDLIQLITSKMNYVVIANHGCVEIPLTPSPPPYCPQIPSFSPIAQISSICQNSPDYVNNSLAPGYNNYLTSKTVSTSPAFPSNTQISASDIPCEIATQNNTALYSTFENPVIRLYFSNPIPVCTTGYNSITDICIKTNISSSA